MMSSAASMALAVAVLAPNVAAFPHYAMDALTKPIAADAAYRKFMERQTSPPQGTGELHELLWLPRIHLTFPKVLCHWYLLLSMLRLNISVPLASMRLDLMILDLFSGRLTCR
jgi:hypothetical protein